MDSDIDYILSLQAVRQRAHHVFSLAKADKLNHFDYHEDRFNDAVQYALNIIKVCNPNNIHAMLDENNQSSVTTGQTGTTRSHLMDAGSTSKSAMWTV